MAVKLGLPQANFAYANDESVRNELYVTVFGQRNIRILFNKLNRIIMDTAETRGDPVSHLEDSIIYMYLFRGYRGEAAVAEHKFQRNDIPAALRRVNSVALTNLAVVLKTRLKALARHDVGDHKHIVRPGAPQRATYKSDRFESVTPPVGVRRQRHR